MYTVYWLFGLFALCLIASIAAAVKISRGTGEEFVLSRTLSGFVSGLSSGATANTGFIVIGAVGMGYSLGLSSLFYPLAWLVGDIAFWYLCARRIYKGAESSDSLSVAELIGDRRHFAAARRFAAAIIVVLLTVYLVAQMISAAKTLQGQIQVSQVLVVFGFAFLVGLYTALGGFLSSVWTDVIQGIGMLILVAGVLGWLGVEVGSSAWADLSGIDPSLVSVNVSLGGVVAFVAFAFVAFGYGLSQPQVTNRLIGLKSREKVVIAAITHISFVQVTWCGMCMIGMYLRIVLPTISDSETALAVLAADRLGAFGPAVIAGMFAAIISSADSLMLGASTAITWDILEGRGERKARLAIHRIAVGVVACLAAVAAVVWKESVFNISVIAASGLGASVGVAVFGTVFKVRRDSFSLCTAMSVGFIVCIAWRFAASNMHMLDAAAGFVAGMVMLFVLRPRVVGPLDQHCD